jgi:hypothetical protein
MDGALTTGEGVSKRGNGKAIIILGRVEIPKAGRIDLLFHSVA